MSSLRARLPATRFRERKFLPEMPEVCRFRGIVIQIYYADHPPVHFHAIYGRHKMKIVIETLEVLGGHLLAR